MFDGGLEQQQSKHRKGAWPMRWISCRIRNSLINSSWSLTDASTLPRRCRYRWWPVQQTKTIKREQRDNDSRHLRLLSTAGGGDENTVRLRTMCTWKSAIFPDLSLSALLSITFPGWCLRDPGTVLRSPSWSVVYGLLDSLRIERLLCSAFRTPAFFILNRRGGRERKRREWRDGI